MKEYTLRHPKCGARWETAYEVSPKMLVCINCGENLPTLYDPLIYVVTIPKEERL